MGINHLETKITVDEFIGRFKSQIDELPSNLSNPLKAEYYENWAEYNQTCAHYGSIDNNKFSFYYKQQYIVNSYTTVITGTIYEKEGLCYIDYEFSKLSGMIFEGLFIFFLFIFSIFILSSDSPWFIFIPVLLIAAVLFAILYKPKKGKEKLVEILKSIALVNQNENNI